MSKQPFLPLFFGDFLASTAAWEGEERALYMLLLAYQWTSGPLPAEPKRLARMCQYDPKAFAKLWPTVAPKFDATDAGLVNRRLEEHRAKSERISKVNEERARGAASKRWRDAPSIAPSIAPSNAPSIAGPDAIHPIPSHPAVLPTSPPESRSPPGPAQAGAREPEPPISPAGQACRSMREAGCLDVNPSHPNLLAALAEGVTPQQLGDLAREMPGKRFAYLVATARSRRVDVPAVAASGGRIGAARPTLLERLDAITTEPSL